MKTNHSNLSSLLFNMNDTKKRHPAQLPDAPFDSCFYILNSNLNPTPEDYRATFLIDADVIGQTAPQFFPKLRLFFRQTAGCPSKTVSLHITNLNYSAPTSISQPQPCIIQTTVTTLQQNIHITNSIS